MSKVSGIEALRCKGHKIEWRFLITYDCFGCLVHIREYLCQGCYTKFRTCEIADPNSASPPDFIQYFHSHVWHLWYPQALTCSEVTIREVIK